MSERITGRLADSAAMERFGAALALAVPRGTTIYLNGPLAAGKTTFARGYIQALGHQGAVKSPTYTLVESYALDGAMIHHFDLYRLADADELEFIGIEEYFEPGNDVLLEWPERGQAILPPADLRIDLLVVGSCREFTLTARNEAYSKIISRFK